VDLMRLLSSKSALLLVVLMLVLSGCGDADDEAADVASDATEVAEGDGAGEPGEPELEANPCGPDGPDEIGGPPGEPPAGDATMVDVTAVDYAFEGIDVTYAPGSYGFAMENAGAELHEAVLVRVDDERPFEELIEISDEEAEGVIEFIGGAIACPGDSAEPFAGELTSGRYAMVCFIPEGFTPEADPAAIGENPPHAVLGMVAEFTVEG
jgi:hypothetical protein